MLFVLIVILASFVPSQKAEIFNQDGFGFSGRLANYNPIHEPFHTTGYNSWPDDFRKGTNAFSVGIYDGTWVWMVPSSADRVIRINPSNGSMTGYNSWPNDFTKSGSTFSGGVYDGTSIWMIPYSADRVVRMNTLSGNMTAYNSWPNGFLRPLNAFFGCVYDGTYVWMIPCNAD
eukprot:PhF_6_TR37512/c2_g1_i3/m.55442